MYRFSSNRLSLDGKWLGRCVHSTPLRCRAGRHAAAARLWLRAIAAEPRSPVFLLDCAHRPYFPPPAGRSAADLAALPCPHLLLKGKVGAALAAATAAKLQARETEQSASTSSRPKLCPTDHGCLCLSVRVCACDLARRAWTPLSAFLKHCGHHRLTGGYNNYYSMYYNYSLRQADGVRS